MRALLLKSSLVLTQSTALQVCLLVREEKLLSALVHQLDLGEYLHSQAAEPPLTALVTLVNFVLIWI